MKRKLLFLTALVVSVFGLKVHAQNFSGENGKYYLQNVSSGKYWGAGNDWGTQASLVKNPEYVILHKNNNGTFMLESQVRNNNNNNNVYFNGDYMDNNTPDNLTITESSEYYTISGSKGYYGYDGSTTVLGKNLDGNSSEALWKIISEEDMIASLANAKAENPVDATFLILDPNFGRNNRNVGEWYIYSSNEKGESNHNLSGGNNINNCAESYHAYFELDQVIQDAPAGVYKLTAQGFYRQDGNDYTNLPYIYLNDVDNKSTFNPRGTILDKYKGSDKDDNMSHASAAFTDGEYSIEPVFIKIERSGDLTVGAQLYDNYNLWCIWDNFELTYYGAEATLAEVKFGDLVKQVKELRDEAMVLAKNENVGAGTLAKLNKALADSETIVENEPAYKNAIAALSAAINQAKMDISNKPAIDALYALAESTNVYTAKAYETFMKMVNDYKDEFDKGTLTEFVVNPDNVAGWHSDNDFDDFLLSAWTIGGEQAKDFDKALYINTWSTEGDTDGTNFRVPFFEYWTADANSLGANKLSATVTKLPAGAYEVSAWVRVRAKNGTSAVDANGVTLYVNEGTAVDVTEGKTEGAFNLAEYKAIGTVGEDGELVITFDVADGNNISWLSFKNVMYKRIVVNINETEGYEASYTNADVVLNRTIKEGMNTLVLPFDLTQEEVEDAFGEGSIVYVVESYANENISFDTQDGIEANVPCLLKATKASTDEGYTFENRTLVAEENPVKEGTDVQMIGTYQATQPKQDSNNYVVSNDKLYLVDSDVTKKATRAYFHIDEPNGVKVISMSFGDDATGIVTVDGSEVLDGNIYDLQGREVKNPARGIYIIGGKKVLVK